MGMLSVEKMRLEAPLSGELVSDTGEISGGFSIHAGSKVRHDAPVWGASLLKQSTEFQTPSQP